MKNMLLRDVLMWLWQFPQNIIGIFIAFIVRADCGAWGTAVLCFSDQLLAGVALGDYILVRRNTAMNTIAHEYGHVKQSRLLGPLYLLVIGVPSLLHNIVHRWCGRRWNYYTFYTERWADQLGGVKR